jgi:hypothetical protein
VIGGNSVFHIHVLRVKCEGLPQGDFLRASSEPATIITNSLRAKPTANVGRGSEWHIGNVKELEENATAFAMGRTQAVKTPQFDEVTHDFVEEEAMRAPFTFGAFDPELQVCGVIRKAGVSQNASEIAGKLATLLNSAPFAREANSVIVVEPIPDPIHFMHAIRSAKAVIRFSFSVSRPNPLDVNRLIQGPAKEFTQAVSGEKTRVETEGSDLDRDAIEDVSKAVAADGEQAAATIQPEGGGPPKRIYLSGNPVVERVEAKPNSSVLAAVLEGARRGYRRVRGSSQQ